MNRYHRTILVVENDEAYAYLIEKAFRANGVTGPIHWIGSASEAIRYFMGEGKYADREKFAYPSFILTDLQMRGQDGFEVLQHLQENPEWAIIPTVVFTSSADADDIKKVYMLGASSFHQKPTDFDGLRRQLKILHDYWMTCFIPEVDSTGRQLMADSKGKLGERFPQPSGGTQTRVNHP
ncbi:MAG: response regulator [Verrucomicrobiia bacterium]